MLELIWSVLYECASYLVGSFNPSYFLARRKGFDIREKGSHNAGGSNALITMGKFIGIGCMIFDILKTVLMIRLAMRLFPESPAPAALAGIFCMIGHIFPFYMNFKGGKGLACLGGIVMAYSPLLFLIMISIEIVLVLVTNYLFVCPLTASIAAPILIGMLTASLYTGLLLALMIPLIWYRHIENIQRLKAGTEVKISYLWKKDSELVRTGNMPSGEEKE